MRTNHPARGGVAPASILITLTLTFAVVGCASDDTEDDAADSQNDDDGSSSGDDGSSGADDGSSGADASSGTDTAACADESAGPPAEALAIVGDWTDDFMGTHAITAESWTQTSEFGTFVYDLASWDNAAGTLVAQDEGDSTWAKFQWVADDADGVYFCQTAFGQACRADAEAVADADATDPATGGCGGMFPWSHLMPAS
jgi:hypothetical protein